MRLGRRIAPIAFAVLVGACTPVPSPTSPSSPSVGRARGSNVASPGASSPGPATRDPRGPASASPGASSPGPATRDPRGPASAYPDPILTPGVALPVGRARICTPGYATGARDVSEADKARVYDRYGVEWVPYQHEVDHLISLELSGSNAIRNLWPEPYVGRWGARTKDVLENRLHDLVCAGELRLRTAQRQEATDWVAAYLRYVGRPPKAGDADGSISPGGYYASSHPSASTIYCADDPQWHDLSPTYRVHFDTLKQAFKRFPTYHLHRPC